MNYPHPLNDGIDHINIYSKGNTELGRFLTNMNNVSVDTPHGKFQSVEGYWHFLKIRLLKPDFDPELFMNLTCYDAKALNKKFSSIQELSEPISEVLRSSEFRDSILSVILSKLKSNPRMVELFKKNTLPFEHYYFYGKVDNPKVHNQTQYSWITEYLNGLEIL